MKSKENINLLCALQAFEIESCRLLGGWLPGIRKWEDKYHICEHLWQDSEHSKTLRTRLWELKVRKPENKTGDTPRKLMERFALTQSDYSFLAAFYQVFKKAMVDAYESLLESAYPVYDAPTVSVVRRILADKKAQLEWANASLEGLLDSGEKQAEAERWRPFFRECMDFFGGIHFLASDESDDKEEPNPPPGAHISPLPFPEALRDDRFEITFTGMPEPEGESLESARLFQFVNYAHEMQAAETLGSVLWETQGMEWEFYYDVARHCYDEARHSKLGETRLRELGHHISDFPHCTTNYNWRQLYDPLRRYCILTYIIETDSFKYKHETYQRYLKESDTASAEAVLYDIMDETLHVRLGQKWVPELAKKAGCEESLEALTKECREILVQHSTAPIQKKYSDKQAAVQ